MDLLSKILQAILEAVLPIMASAFTIWLIAKAKEITERLKRDRPDEYYQIMDICRIVVQAAEQIYKNKGMGEAKKKYAMETIEKWLDSKGLKIDTDIIVAAIESEVRSMNMCIKKEEPEAVNNDANIPSTI